MGKVQAIRKEEIETNEPPSLHGRAMDNLAFIRETMERSAVFTSIPGYGGMLMGATAIGASIIAYRQIDFANWLTVWVAEAVLAFVIGLFAMWQKSKIVKTPLTSAPARKFAFGFLPPIVCGVILTFALFRLGTDKDLIVGTWLLLYGAAVACGGMSSVRIVPVVGWLFMLLGAIAFFVPAMFSDWLMAIGFGGLQILFGLIIARKFGG